MRGQTCEWLSWVSKHFVDWTVRDYETIGSSRISAPCNSHFYTSTAKLHYITKTVPCTDGMLGLNSAQRLDAIKASGTEQLSILYTQRWRE
ncbi:beta-nerve growth factor isoform X2 [Aquarana catesbeiana]|uniref:beta-nerve growth factor isoform X2 n=1 Tax=Aquarana catesbeiana TaxID=8400 RepID=UPI003CC94868